MKPRFRYAELFADRQTEISERSYERSLFNGQKTVSKAGFVLSRTRYFIGKLWGLTIIGGLLLAREIAWLEDLREGQGRTG